jgi:hypothetical protein
LVPLTVSCFHDIYIHIFTPISRRKKQISRIITFYDLYKPFLLDSLSLHVLMIFHDNYDPGSPVFDAGDHTGSPQVWCVLQGFIIAFTSEYIPRLVYQFSHGGSLDNYVNHTLADFDIAVLQNPPNANYTETKCR